MIFRRIHSDAGRLGLTLLWAIAGSTGSGLAGAESAPATQPATRQSAPDPAAVRSTVADLNHPSRAHRQSAVRRLASWGLLVTEALREAVNHGPHETALTAAGLLAELESLLLTGAQVSLRFEPDEVNWNESCTLMVEVTNVSPSAVRLPWPRPEPNEATSKVAMQVGAVLDVADFLEVTDAEGDIVSTRVDPIEQRADIQAVVAERISDTPPVHMLGPGQREVMIVPEFNRGWVRYPLLAKGSYTVRLVYQPQWRREQWTREGLGRVESNKASLRVTHSAPERVAGSQRMMRLEIREDDEQVVALLHNLWDRPVLVADPSQSRRSALRRFDWQLIPMRDGDVVEFAGPGEGIENEHVAPLVALPPDETLVIAALSMRELQQRVAEDLPEESAKFVLAARYTLLEEAKNDEVPEASATLPRFVGVLNSDPITIHLDDDQ